jgi:hypothetical protein
MNNPTKAINPMAAPLTRRPSAPPVNLAPAGLVTLPVPTGEKPVLAGVGTTLRVFTTYTTLGLLIAVTGLLTLNTSTVIEALGMVTVMYSVVVSLVVVVGPSLEISLAGGPDGAGAAGDEEATYTGTRGVLEAGPDPVGTIGFTV